MKVALLTREFPPEVYGGAGVHVEHLAAEVARLIDVGVHCFGAPRSSALVGAAYQPWQALADGTHSSVLEPLSVNLAMAQGVAGSDLVHSHTWYTNMGGHLAKLLYAIPHVITAHSLEPLRPWKAKQLGSGYELSLFCERTAAENADAIIAVSGAMRSDILTTYREIDPARVVVIHNGVDTQQYRPDPGTDVLERLGIDPTRPSVIFVGRITHQKGIVHLLEAASWIEPFAQLVLCAGAADTPEIEGDVAQRVAVLRGHRDGVFWLREMLPRAEVVQLLSHATVFVCPSLYEPFGLVNVEAMACGAPIVATATGGIPEIVVDGVTGHLVQVPSVEGPGAADARERLAKDLAAGINDLVADPAKARRFGQLGRQRVVEHFSWPAIAAETVALYRRLQQR